MGRGGRWREYERKSRALFTLALVGSLCGCGGVGALRGGDKLLSV